MHAYSTLPSNHFSERELVDLTYAVMAINAWNRLAIAFRKQPRVWPQN
jgi:alkylhydroperoxidase family enzyme